MFDTDGLLNPPNISRACGLNLVDPGTSQGDDLAEQTGQDGDGSDGVFHIYNFGMVALQFDVGKER